MNVLRLMQEHTRFSACELKTKVSFDGAQVHLILLVENLLDFSYVSEAPTHEKKIVNI